MSTVPLVTRVPSHCHSINSLTIQATKEATEAEAASATTPTFTTTAISDPMDEEALAITHHSTTIITQTHNTIQMDPPPRQALVRMARSDTDEQQTTTALLDSTVSRII
ncbi:hypothetical protein CPC16_005822, partial [Podila verticillata]